MAVGFLDSGAAVFGRQFNAETVCSGLRGGGLPQPSRAGADAQAASSTWTCTPGVRNQDSQRVLIVQRPTLALTSLVL